MMLSGLIRYKIVDRYTGVRRFFVNAQVISVFLWGRSVTGFKFYAKAFEDKGMYKRIKLKEPYELKNIETQLENCL